jgi:hypothetical protein
MAERARLVVPDTPTRKTNFSQIACSIRSLISASMPPSAQASRNCRTRADSEPSYSPNTSFASVPE